MSYAETGYQKTEISNRLIIFASYFIFQSLEKTKQTRKLWYALYTRPRYEKKAQVFLQEKGIEVFLPLYKTLRQWSDRKKFVELPLFSSYIFVHTDAQEFHSVLSTVGIVKFVSFEGKAVPIPQRQMENLFLLINGSIEIEKTHKVFKPGQKVKVCVGPMQGLTGELVKAGSKDRVLIRFEHINQNLLVNIPANFLVSNY